MVGSVDQQPVLFMRAFLLAGVLAISPLATSGAVRAGEFGFLPPAFGWSAERLDLMMATTGEPPPSTSAPAGKQSAAADAATPLPTSRPEDAETVDMSGVDPRAAILLPNDGVLPTASMPAKSRAAASRTLPLLPPVATAAPEAGRALGFAEGTNPVQAKTASNELAAAALAVKGARLQDQPKRETVTLRDSLAPEAQVTAPTDPVPPAPPRATMKAADKPAAKAASNKSKSPIAKTPDWPLRMNATRPNIGPTKTVAEMTGTLRSTVQKNDPRPMAQPISPLQAQNDVAPEPSAGSFIFLRQPSVEKFR